FCTPEQLKDEISKVIDFAQFMLEAFGLKFSTFLSTRPEEFAGTVEEWEHAEGTLKEVLEEKGIPYEIDEGSAVFYGPKIDMKTKDVLGRLAQGPTVQFDFNLPRRFDVTYIGEDGKEHNVVMVHRVVLGSLERFFGILIEYYGGAFPLWLSPVQVRILSVSGDNLSYGEKICSRLQSSGVRVEFDSRNETLNYKIREAEREKIPYVVVVGKNEEKNGTISVRKRKMGDQGKIGVDEFIKNIKEEIENRT
ncbi:MAG TPA: threonine--tRNA ligase, partial [Candidatus Omnitrophica bacterium]|nr:threonine--tRNA ligase [Candidatus Omnitrophota bacterium]